MKTFPKYLLPAAFLLSDAIAAAQSPREVRPETPLSIHTLVYNQGGMDAATLNETMAVSARVLERARVKLVWSDCSTRGRVEPIDEMCTLPLPANGFVLVIQQQFGAKLRRSALGYAIVPGKRTFGNRLNVSLQRARHLAEKYNVALASVLGCGIAHELGHLLLQSQEHAAGGVMCAQWGNQELVDAARNNLIFTAAEAARMRAGLRAKMQMESTAASLRQPL